MDPFAKFDKEFEKQQRDFNRGFRIAIALQIIFVIAVLFISFKVVETAVTKANEFAQCQKEGGTYYIDGDCVKKD